MNLNILGYNDYFRNQFKENYDKGLIPARVVFKQKNNYLLYYNDGSIKGKLCGKFRYNASLKKDYPSVGDWVAIKTIDNCKEAIIYHLLQRKTAFVRKTPISGGRKIKNNKIVGGTIEEQVIASNVDTVFIISALDRDFNIQRIERYITLVYNSGARPVIILNKVDICNNLDDYINEVENVAIDIPIYPVSVIKNINMDVFNNYLLPGKTIVFLGSSGVGKSTITNYLIGENKQNTKTVSNVTGKGRHTTTSAELLIHSSGCMIIDTPGLRELQLWGDEESVEETFEDIVEITKNCRFNDCNHDTEPGCAIKKAIEDEIISNDRFERYMKQLGEINELSSNQKMFMKNIGRINKRKMQMKFSKNR